MRIRLPANWTAKEIFGKYEGDPIDGMCGRFPKLRALADEIFRVFANEHPNMRVIAVNAGPDVEATIARARARGAGVKNST